MHINQDNSCIEILGDFSVLSSAPLNGGLQECKRITNVHTPEKEAGPVSDYIQKTLSLTEPQLAETVGFVTSADITNAFTGDASVERHFVKVILTAGVGDPVDYRYHHTINVILVTDLDLSVTSMANLFIVITEAKSAALAELDVFKNGKRSTGTPTDAIAVAVLGGRANEMVKYSGTATELGRSVYSLVKAGVRQSLKDNNGYGLKRNILTRLAERGVTLEKIVDAAMSMTVGEISAVDIEADFVKIIEDYSTDLNVHFLLASAFQMEEETKRTELAGDPSLLISDELIGINIAEYIGGKNALFNFIRYDREKPGLLADLPPFLDDAVGGLIAGAMTKVFSERQD